jgi:alcohol dehydrogenase class IV
MDLVFYVPTKIIMGKGCLKKNAGLLAKHGKKALIITYPVSRENGSLQDTEEALRSQDMKWHTCIDAPTNPELSEMRALGEMASQVSADMVIGIGGGSALDTAKTVAVLATNRISPDALYANTFDNRPLDVITVPTTSGSGSEVTPYAVLTIKEKNIKKSFGNEDLMSPVYAFLDATYTETLPAQVSADTAVDALSHGIEGYLSKKGNWVSDMIGNTIFKNFASAMQSLKTGRYSFDIREKLLFNAALSGIMINHMRTLAVHAMGYSLTMNKGLSHGAACGILLGSFLEYVYAHSSQKIDEMLKNLGLHHISEFSAFIESVLKQDKVYTKEEIAQYADESAEAASAKPNPKDIDRDAVIEIYSRALLKTT